MSGRSRQRDEVQRDRFSAALAACNPDSNLFADLAVGVPGEVLTNGARAGAAQVLYGTSFGILIDPKMRLAPVSALLSRAQASG